MISFYELFENAHNLGGTIARTAVSLAVPIPGAGIVLSPVASLYGEAIGEKIPTDKVPDIMKDSVRVYKTGDQDNTSFLPRDQFKARQKYAKKAKQLGYNKIGQTVAAIDPGLLTVTPDVVSKKSFLSF